MLLIVVISFIQLIFFSVLVATLVTDFDETDQNVFSFIFVMAVFAFPLHYGVKLWKAGKAESKPIQVLENAEKIIRVNSKMDFADYRTLMLKLTYTNPIVLYVNVIGLGMLMPSLMNGELSLTGIAIGFVFIALPVVAIFQFRGNYNASKTLKEMASYEFDVKNIVITGETFNTSLQWSSLYKVKEMNNWFMLYTAKNVAIIVSKRSFSPEDIATLRSFAQYNRITVQ
jgi:hypothetical protein